MSLSGNLGFVSLDEVLRLLIRSGQRGRVTVRGEKVEGRVFVTRGGVTLATTDTDEDLEVLFRKSQIIDPRDIESGQIDQNVQDVVDLIREFTVESIYRLNLHGDNFDVTEGVEARFASPKPFELEQVLEESRKRLEDWAEVSQVVSDLDARLAFVRDLGDREEIRIRRDAWKVLSEVGAGASVSQVASALGTTEFWAARVVARLMEDDLLVTGYDRDHKADEHQTWETAVQPTHETTRPTDETTQPEDVYEYSYEEAEETPESEDETSYFQEAPEVPDEHAQAIPEASFEDAPLETEESEEQPSSEAEATRSWWEEPSDEAGEVAESEVEGDEADVEEDTEAFLEKVFSELDSSEDEDEEGYGLLRRRRLGAMRDLGRDS